MVEERRVKTNAFVRSNLYKQELCSGGDKRKGDLLYTQYGDIEILWPDPTDKELIQLCKEFIDRENISDLDTQRALKIARQISLREYIDGCIH